MASVQFEAGSQFADPKGLIDAAATAATETPPGADAGEQAVPEVPSTWEDKDPNADDTEGQATDGTPAAPTPSEFAEIEVKGAKGVHKFKLDPNDQALQSALKLGAGARAWQRERDEARKALGEIQPKYQDAAEKAKVWDELETLARQGHQDRVVKAVLGEEGYANLVKQIVNDVVKYESASPEDRARMDQDRTARDRDWQNTVHQRKEKTLEDKYQALEDRVESDRLRSLGTNALQRFDFNGFVEDKDLAGDLNNKLWRLAWSELEDAAESGANITPEAITRAFAANAKVLRAGQARMVKEGVAKVIETKKQDATRKAQVAATARYPTQTADVSQWDGRRSKDLLKMLVGRR